MKYPLQKLADVIINPGDIDVPQPDQGLTSTRVENGLAIFFGATAAVAVLVVAISALRLVISRGNPNDVQKARDAIIYASIGLTISLFAFMIVRFVLGRM